jgi:hypothetical protein
LPHISPTGHHGLAVQMPAALREALVLELDHRGAGALQAAHRALHVERVAEAGVGIDDDRHGHALGDARQRVLHLGEGGQAHVGAAQPGVGDRRARQVQRLEAGLLGDQRGQRVVDAGGQQRLRLGQPGLERVHGFTIPFAVSAAMAPPATALSRPLPER